MIEKTRKDWEEERPALLGCLYEYAERLRHRPLDNEEGLRGVSAFALYWFLKQITPTLVIEVGVWKGFSTWLIEQAAPHAEIACFDPLFFLESKLDPNKLGPTYRTNKARYYPWEFSCADIPKMIAGHERPCVFFDDHQDKVARLLQAKAFGLKHIVFDDNVPFAYTHRSFEAARHDPAVLALMRREIQAYEIFPALWDVDWQFGDARVKEDGMAFPLDEKLSLIYEDRKYHSYVTRIELKSPRNRPTRTDQHAPHFKGTVKRVLRGLDAALGGYGKKVYRRWRNRQPTLPRS